MSEQTRETKNAVFSGPAQNPEPQKQQSVAKKDPLFDDEPVELAPLASCGLLYPVDHPFHGMKAVEIKAITAHEEDILTNKAYAKKGTTLSELLKSCVCDKRVDVNSLLLADRQTLIVAIRAAGYGSLYEDEVTCSDPECGVKSMRQFDLSGFEIKTLDPSVVVEVGKNIFNFKLPSSGHIVEFRLLTGFDEEEMLVTAQRQKKLMGAEGKDGITSSLLRSIVSVAGVTDRVRISKFVQSMRGVDSLALRRQINAVSPGIQTVQKMACPACGLEEEVSMPLGVSFFWPRTE